MRTENDLAQLVTPDRVHRDLYVDREIFEQEMRKIYHRAWLFGAHESEFPDPGDYVTRNVANEPLIFSRDRDGEIHVLYNRCAHRGARVCVEDVGRAHSFRCQYHGWTYNSDGTLTGVPFRGGYDNPIDQLRESMSLANVPRWTSRDGFVFVCFAPDGPTFEEFLGEPGMEMLERVSAISPSGRISLEKGWLHHRVKANWKIVMENQVDGYHIQFTHGSLFEGAKGPRDDLTYGNKSASTLRALGQGHSEVTFFEDYRRTGAEFGWFGSVSRSKIPTYVEAMVSAYGEAEASRRFVDGPPHGLVFPNLFLAEMNIFVAEPVAPNLTLTRTAAISIPDCPDVTVRQLRRTEAGLGPAGMLIADDSEIAERNQLGLVAERPEWVDLKRGRTTDQTQTSGVVEAHDLTGELPQRAFWKKYLEDMESR